jgi:hypothetical protein
MSKNIEKTELIYGHTIIYYWLYEEDGINDSLTLDDSDIEHIKSLLEEDYIEGELNQYDPETDREYRGWWRIQN